MRNSPPRRPSKPAKYRSPGWDGNYQGSLESRPSVSPTAEYVRRRGYQPGGAIPYGIAFGSRRQSTPPSTGQTPERDEPTELALSSEPSSTGGSGGSSSGTSDEGSGEKYNSSSSDGTSSSFGGDSSEEDGTGGDDESPAIIDLTSSPERGDQSRAISIGSSEEESNESGGLEVELLREAEGGVEELVRAGSQDFDTGASYVGFDGIDDDFDGPDDDEPPTDQVGTQYELEDGAFDEFRDAFDGFPGGGEPRIIADARATSSVGQRGAVNDRSPLSTLENILAEPGTPSRFGAYQRAHYGSPPRPNELQSSRSGKHGGDGDFEMPVTYRGNSEFGTFVGSGPDDEDGLVDDDEDRAFGEASPEAHEVPQRPAAPSEDVLPQSEYDEELPEEESILDGPAYWPGDIIGQPGYDHGRWPDVNSPRFARDADEQLPGEHNRANPEVDDWDMNTRPAPLALERQPRQRGVPNKTLPITPRSPTLGSSRDVGNGLSRAVSSFHNSPGELSPRSVRLVQQSLERIRTLEGEANDRAARLAALEDENELLAQQNLKLEQERNLGNGGERDEDDLNGCEKALAECCDDREKSLEKLKNQNAMIEELSTTLGQQQSARRAAESERDDCKNAVSILRKDARDSTKRILMLSEQLEEQSASVEASALSAIAADSDSGSIKSQNDRLELERRIDELEEQVVISENRLEDVAAEHAMRISELDEQNTTLQATITGLQEQVLDVTILNERLQAEYSQLQDEHDREQVEAQFAAEQAAGPESHVAADTDGNSLIHHADCDEERPSDQDRIKALEDEIESLKIEEEKVLNEIVAADERASEEISRLQAEIEGLRQGSERVQEELLDAHGVNEEDSEIKKQMAEEQAVLQRENDQLNHQLENIFAEQVLWRQREIDELKKKLAECEQHRSQQRTPAPAPVPTPARSKKRKRGTRDDDTEEDLDDEVERLSRRHDDLEAQIREIRAVEVEIEEYQRQREDEADVVEQRNLTQAQFTKHRDRDTNSVADSEPTPTLPQLLPLPQPRNQCQARTKNGQGPRCKRSGPRDPSTDEFRCDQHTGH